jgi:methyltransferase
MSISVKAYLLLLALVGSLRIAEVILSGRNQRRMIAKGIAKIPERYFPWMVLFHIGILLSAALEVVLLRRPLIPTLAMAAGILMVLATGLRWWVIRTMSEHWNIQIMSSAKLGVVVGGPFRWIRHPNYVAVFVELIALPLIYSAWITALTGAIVHAWILSRRIKTEESVLLSSSAYVAEMSGKPRFVPRLFHATKSTEVKPRGA